MQVKRLILVAVLVGAVQITGCAIVDSGNVGVVKSWGTVSKETVQPGLHPSFPMAREITPMSVQTIASPEKFTSLTQDAQKIDVTATATFYVNPEKAADAFIQVGSQEKIDATIVQPVLLSAVKNVVSKYSMTFIIENQTKVSQEIKDEIVARLKLSGYVIFQDFQVTGFVLDPNVQDSVEKKQIALQELERKQTELKTAQIEAQRLNALSVSLTPQVLTKLAIDKWNGVSLIPPGQAGSTPPVILSPQAEQKK